VSADVSLLNVALDCRPSNGSSMSGRSGTRTRATSKASTTSSSPSSRRFLPPTSVGPVHLRCWRSYSADPEPALLAPDVDPEAFDVSLLPEHALSAVEADSFWCLDRMLSGVHDYYIVAQPGIIRSVRKMAELVARIDRASERA
jgi:hypothetical protein